MVNKKITNIRRHKLLNKEQSLLNKNDVKLGLSKWVNRACS